MPIYKTSETAAIDRAYIYTSKCAYRKARRSERRSRRFKSVFKGLYYSGAVAMAAIMVVRTLEVLGH